MAINQYSRRVDAKCVRFSRRVVAAVAAVVLIWTGGGGSHHDTWDPKTFGFSIDRCGGRWYSRHFFGTPRPAGPAASQPLKVLASCERSSMDARERGPPVEFVIAASPLRAVTATAVM
jgi:hypothetical protein